MSSSDNFNTPIIEAFRAKNGAMVIPGNNAPLLLLTTVGAKSGKVRVNPLAYLLDGERWIIFASKAGQPTNPDWYYNLLKNPQVTVEVGPEKLQATAVELHGEERDRLYEKQAALFPVFVEYQAKTDRLIPVIALQR